MLLKLYGFHYSTSIDLSTGYYHIPLRKKASNLCTIILPWEKYSYKHLPMGISHSSESFQQKTNDLFHGFELIREYIDEILILTKEDWTDHVQKM